MGLCLAICITTMAVENQRALDKWCAKERTCQRAKQLRRHHFLHDNNCGGCIKLLSKVQNHTLMQNMNIYIYNYNMITKDQHYFLQKEELVVLILWVSGAKSEVSWSLGVFVLRSKPRSAQRMALPSPAARFQISTAAAQLYSSELQASRTDAKATRRTAPW